MLSYQENLFNKVQQFNYPLINIHKVEVVFDKKNIFSTIRDYLSGVFIY